VRLLSLQVAQAGEDRRPKSPPPHHPTTDGFYSPPDRPFRTARQLRPLGRSRQARSSNNAQVSPGVRIRREPARVCVRTGWCRAKTDRSSAPAPAQRCGSAKDSPAAAQLDGEGRACVCQVARQAVSASPPAASLPQRGEHRIGREDTPGSWDAAWRAPC